LDIEIENVECQLSQTCERCAHNYPLELDDCIHCTSLSDDAANHLRQQKHAEHRSLTRLALLFFLAAILLTGVLIFYNMSL